MYSATHPVTGLHQAHLVRSQSSPAQITDYLQASLKFSLIKSKNSSQRISFATKTQLKASLLLKVGNPSTFFRNVILILCSAGGGPWPDGQVLAGAEPKWSQLFLHQRWWNVSYRASRHHGVLPGIAKDFWILPTYGEDCDQRALDHHGNIYLKSQ